MSEPRSTRPPLVSSRPADKRLQHCTPVYVKAPLPCFTILVHGVNDVGTAYGAQEAGLVRGLAARLDRANSLERVGGDLVAARYRGDLQALLDELRRSDAGAAERGQADPDRILFRREAQVDGRAAYSGVIPFYWGYREVEGDDPSAKNRPYIRRDLWHGQWTDRHGNRLDKKGRFGGGPFANATTNLPDIWAEGLDPALAADIDGIVRDSLRPMRGTPPRGYMVLAALRLAMLIEMLHAKVPGAAVNVLAHSQGTLIALLAQALLAERGAACADCLILQHSCYGLRETLGEKVPRRAQQQTSAARIATLDAIVGAVQASARSVQPLSALADALVCSATVGEHWWPGPGAKKSHAGRGVAFTERDNRGKVYVYFCPHDETVRLLNVQGIGAEGLPDRLAMPREPKGPQRSAPVLDVLGAKGLRQRVFWQARGAPWVGAEGRDAIELPRAPLLSLQSLPGGERRTLNGEPLTPPCKPCIGPDVLPVDAIEAATALTSQAGPLLRRRDREDIVADPRPASRHAGRMNEQDAQALRSRLQADEDARARNEARAKVGEKEADELWREYRREVAEIVPLGDGRVVVAWYEPPIATRERQHGLNTIRNRNSYHSAIPSEARHHEEVTAYDLAIGAPIPPQLEEDGWLDFVRAVADWRTDWEDLPETRDSPAAREEHRKQARQALEGYHAVENARWRPLIDDAFRYAKDGTLPEAVHAVRVLRLVHAQSAGERQAGRGMSNPFVPPSGVFDPRRKPR